MLRWKFAKIFRYQDVFWGPWLPCGVQLPIPWINHLSHFQFAHAFSCSLIRTPLLICDHILWRSVIPVIFLHRGEMPSTWNGFAEGLLLVLAVWQLKRLRRSAVHAIDTAQLELWNSTWFYVQKTNFQVHMKNVTFCVSSVHTSFVHRHETWAWNHNLLLGGTWVSFPNLITSILCRKNTTFQMKNYVRV